VARDSKDILIWTLKGERWNSIDVRKNFKAKEKNLDKRMVKIDSLIRLLKAFLGTKFDKR